MVGVLMGATSPQPRDSWWPPQPDSRCWSAYQNCTLDAYADYQNGTLSPEQLSIRLGECKNALTACAIYEWIKRQFGDDAAANWYMQAIGEEDAAVLVDFFAEPQ